MPACPGHWSLESRLDKRLFKKMQAAQAQNKCIRFYLSLKNTAQIWVTEFKAINWLPTKNRIGPYVCVNVMKFFKGTAQAQMLRYFVLSTRTELREDQSLN